MKILVSGRARSEGKPSIIGHSWKKVIKEQEVYDEMLVAMRMTMIIAVISMVMVMTMTKKMQDEWLELLYDYEKFKVPLMTLLRGQCHEIFRFRFCVWIIFHQAPENNTRVIENFFENSRRYSQVKVHHRYQRHWWQICHRYQWAPVATCQRYYMQIDTSGNNENNFRLLTT